MGTRSKLHFRRGKGFTLIELMITVAIVTILASVALPGFMSSIRKSRRTEARTALLDLAARAERFYSTTNSYLDAANSLTPFDLGLASATTATWPVTLGSGYYSFNATVTTPTAFTFVATAVDTQQKDTDCASFTVTNTGLQSSLNSSNANSTATCWK
jgi:type IV pilus assembly protein PilE